MYLKSTRNQVLEVVYFLWQAVQKYHFAKTQGNLHKDVNFSNAPLVQTRDFQGCFLMVLEGFSAQLRAATGKFGFTPSPKSVFTPFFSIFPKKYPKNFKTAFKLP